MKVKLSEEFQEWFKKTNSHLFVEKKPKRGELQKEVEEYVNDVILEHMEFMDEFLRKNSGDK
jgi:hypothetical protein|tara:strand:+ start:1633 stop:1818 length:186 start_codon:yes stop_codon:yes gene_type:complete